jgi:hypothetical protein
MEGSRVHSGTLSSRITIRKDGTIDNYGCDGAGRAILNSGKSFHSATSPLGRTAVSPVISAGSYSATSPLGRTAVSPELTTCSDANEGTYPKRPI